MTQPLPTQPLPTQPLPQPSLDNAVARLKAQIDAPVAAFLSSCVHCGLCADACPFYVATEDPDYAPVLKLDLLRRVWRMEFTLLGRIGKALGLLRPLTDADFEAHARLIYDSCTLCGRCTLACPVGNDLTLMVRKTREGMSAAGYAPPELVYAAKRHLGLGSPMGNLRPALEAQVKAARAATGLDITFDQAGVDYMAIFSAQGIAEYAGVIAAMAKIFDKAGITWTIATEAFEASNVGVQIGNAELARALVDRVVTAAERLGVKAVIAPECGHAYQALRWEGPNLLGRPYAFDVVHVIELLDRLLDRGAITLKQGALGRFTFHDPCQINRRGGIDKEPRRLLNAVARDVSECDEGGTWNWCCGAGGGVGANERALPLREAAFRLKKQQFEKSGATQVATMCAYCHHTLEGAIEDNDMSLEVVSLVELVADNLAP